MGRCIAKKERCNIFMSDLSLHISLAPKKENNFKTLEIKKWAKDWK
jgi:hypothetical protein